MKTIIPTLAFTGFALLFTASALADTEQDSKLERAWNRIEDAGANVRDGVEMAVDDFVGFSRDVIHERPELQALPHLILLRKGDDVKVAYCRPLVAQLFRDRRRHPSHNRCDEVLTKGSFNIKELQACSAKHSQDGGAAFNLERQLARVIRRDENYTYNFLGMYGSREEYRDLFRTCANERRPARPRPAPAPAVGPGSRPAHDLPPAELPPAPAGSALPPVETAPVQMNGTL